MSVSVCSSCGGVSSVHSPLVVVEGGAIVDGGVSCVVVGGMLGKGGSVTDSPSNVSVPVCVLVSPLSFTLWPY